MHGFRCGPSVLKPPQRLSSSTATDPFIVSNVVSALIVFDFMFLNQETAVDPTVCLVLLNNLGMF
jgi:hypothetical protein